MIISTFSPSSHRRGPPSCLFCVSRFLIAGLIATVALYGQGSLIPPAGPPEPTMKTLDQVEARTIVNATNTPGDAANTYIISAPGSYYLAGNITGAAGKHGISILASNVTLDLNGFALIGGGEEGATRGVNTSTPISNLSIRNGSIHGWSGGGVRAEFAVVLAEKLVLSGNLGGPGLAVGNGSMIKDCVATGNATGFYCPDRTQISHCIATVNTGNGFDCTAYVNLLDCTSSRNGGSGFATLGGCSLIRCSATRNLPNGSGIVAGVGCTVTDCTGSNNGLDGIRVGSGSNIRDCTAQANGSAGIVAASDSHLTGNTCQGNPTGIRVTGHDNRVDGNICHTQTPAGLCFHIQGTNNVVVRNTARAPLRSIIPGIVVAEKAYVFDSADSNSYGPVHNSAGGIIPASLSPWANFQNP
jgi:hypothetical protein